VGAVRSGSSPFNASFSLSRSRPFSQRATTIVATALPMKLVRLRHSLMKRSTPRISAMPAIGTVGTVGTIGTIDNVAASVMKPAPVTPAARQLANLGVQRLHVDRMLRRFAMAVRPENPRCAFEQLAAQIVI